LLVHPASAADINVNASRAVSIFLFIVSLP
jgi:hypothetical protein